MKKGIFRIILGSMAMVLATLACGFSASTANISDAYMARDEAGTSRTTVFAQDEIFYCIIDLSNAPDDTTVTAVWYAVEAQDTEPNLLIDEVGLTTGSAIIPFNLTNTSLWPIGTYKVEIFLNGTLDRTLEFEVQ